MSNGRDRFKLKTNKYEIGTLETVNVRLIEDIMRRLSRLEEEGRDKSQDEWVWRICLIFGIVLTAFL